MKISKTFILVFAFCILNFLVGYAREDRSKTARERIAIGMDRISQNKLEDAIKEFKAALALEPHNFEAHYELGVAYYKSKDFEKAEDSLKSAVKFKPKESKVYNMLGLVYEKKGLFDEARNFFQEALNINKKFGEARTNLLDIEKAKREYSLYRFAMEFIYPLSKEYSNGNNAFMRGVNETKAIKTEASAMARYDINTEIYLAKEYFDKCSKLLEDAVDRITVKGLSDIIDTFSMAIQQRQEAIDLQIQGYSITDDYSGEFERAKAKTKIADTYYVDAAKKLQAMMLDGAEVFDEKDFANIGELIRHYSQDESKEIELAK